jgi:hypothetical protein
MHMHLLDPAYIPALGIGAWWTMLMLNVHTFWSVGVSIALVEALFPEAAELPWLGGVGDVVVAVVFLLGLAANTSFQLRQHLFMASHRQFFSVGVASIVLIVAAFLLPARRARTKSGSMPSPWVFALLALLLGLAVMQTTPRLGWWAVAILLVVDAIFLQLAGLFSQRNGWTPMHTFSFAAGGAVAYGLHAFLQKPLIPGSLLMARVSNAVFLAAAIAVIFVAAKRTARLTVSPSLGTLEL